MTSGNEEPGTPERPEPASTRSASAPDDRHGGNYAGMGLQFALSILLFLWIGHWLDGKLHTAPWLLIAGTFLGAGAGIYSMVRRANADEKAENAARQARTRGGKP